MSKKLRTAIIGGIVLVILAVAVVLLLNMPENTGGTDDTSSSFIEDVEVVTLYEEDYKTLKKLHVINEVDEYTVESIGEAEWGIAELGEFDSPAPYQNLINGISNVVATSVVVEEYTDEDLKTYGLDEPKMTIEAEFTDGKVYKLQVGDMPSYSTAYTLINDEKTIYQVPTTKYEPLMGHKYDFLSAENIIPALEINEDGTEAKADVKFMQITRPDLEVPITFERYSDEELSNPDAMYMVGVYMTSPAKCEVRSSTSDTQIYVYAGLSGDSVVSINTTKEEAESKYGFDAPTSTFVYQPNGGEKITLITGSKLQQDLNGVPTDYYYVMREGVSAVYTMLASKMPWMTVQPESFISPIVLIPPILTIDKIDITVDGKLDTLDYTHDESDKAETSATLSGKDVDGTNAKKLLQLLYNPDAEGFNKETPQGEPFIKIDYYLLDGTHQKLDIHVREDRKTIISVNGEALFVGRSGYVEKLAAELENLRNGKTVDTEW